MTTETAPRTSPPATEKQIQTIARMERTLGIPKAQRVDPDGLSRAEASEHISSMISQMNALVGDDDAPAAPATQDTSQPNARELAAQQRERQRANEKIARVQAQHPEQRDLAQGEWPPVPAASSEAQAEDVWEEGRIKSTSAFVGAQASQQVAPAPRAAAPVSTASDNPFDAPGNDDLVLGTLSDEDDNDPELVRVVPSPVGKTFAFQITSADWVPPKSSPYGGIRLTCVGLPVPNEQGETAEGTESQDYLSMNPNSRWRHEALLAAINEQRCRRSRLPGHTFWGTTEDDTYEYTNDKGEKRVTKRTRIADYLQGPTPPAIKAKTNGVAPREKVTARLGAEFDVANEDRIPF